MNSDFSQNFSKQPPSRGQRRSLRRVAIAGKPPRHRWMLSPVERTYRVIESRGRRAVGRARHGRSAARAALRSRTSGLVARNDDR